ncbi:MAG: hypothetical protein K2J06_07035 [Muribaculaceae bacterium]|nr:hypothetical protein [Muribaculaceae bacterium]
MKDNNNKSKAMTREELFGKDPSTAMIILYTLGLLCIGVATLIPIVHGGFGFEWFRYLYAAGAVMVVVGRLFSHYTGKHTRMKRLRRMESWSSIIFCVAAFFLFYDKGNNRDWLAFTMAGAAVQVIATILMTRVASKELKKKD